MTKRTSYGLMKKHLLIKKSTHLTKENLYAFQKDGYVNNENEMRRAPEWVLSSSYR
jgi:hypothetical protein